MHRCEPDVPPRAAAIAAQDETTLREPWRHMRARLQAKGLLVPSEATLSLRNTADGTMWFGARDDEAPQRMPWCGMAPSVRGAGLHAAIYACRADVGAIAAGGGAFGLCLADFGAVMPGVFDEQARHLGCMPAGVEDPRDLAPRLGGGGNVLVARGLPVCLGMTASRATLNAELFEKCAKAYVLAMASGGHVRPLPWIVRTVANRRLLKDERRAAQRFGQGLLPEESRGY